MVSFLGRKGAAGLVAVRPQASVGRSLQWGCVHRFVVALAFRVLLLFQSRLRSSFSLLRIVGLSLSHGLVVDEALLGFPRWLFAL
ncbi:hypothetical protein BRADI_3g49136v3 [Brachypodium distachyon]|uniref:Uncharacterized protein n=1 Tax=Brachypodium distachyon TaxID=15368 RepID=A0A2K2D497_BRADI|nr:hypothetical protein BRADI_3g49136v3 [Brachypodium distachyon]